MASALLCLPPSHSFCRTIPPSRKSPTSTLKHTQSAVEQNASGYTARQSHAAVWPCCGMAWTPPGLSAGVDLGLYTAQREILQSRGWKYPRERGRQEERKRKRRGGTTAGEEITSKGKEKKTESETREGSGRYTGACWAPLFQSQLHWTHACEMCCLLLLRRDLKTCLKCVFNPCALSCGC